MRLSGLLALGLGAARGVAALGVTNTISYTTTDWQKDIGAAKSAGIDGFAMNMQTPDEANQQIATAFSVAASNGFKLFFSFDYGGSSTDMLDRAWRPDTIKSFITTWGNHEAYYKHNGKPLVSTFEGPTFNYEWRDIIAETNCFFVPDYSSLGAEPAASTIGHGLFNWAAWPAGPNDMNTYIDASYMQALAGAGKAYMMPVSPWFYTNLPGFNKNWLWRGDDLWFDRWLQVISMSRIQKDFDPPEFAQIISWNDFGESHYIGPIVEKALYALDIGKAPFDFVTSRHHDGWRFFLPFLIQLAKTGRATVGTQGVVTWFRRTGARTCGNGGTVGNTASQLQLEYPPEQGAQDKIFFSALLGAPAPVTVKIGGVTVDAQWTDTPAGGAGLYHGSVDTGGRIGRVVVEVAGIATVTGNDISGGCSSVEFNAHVYWESGPQSSAVVDVNSYHCVQGFGVGGLNNICQFSCKYGYCPVTACTCSKIGPKPTMPTPVYKDGYPTDGNVILSGLCGFSVNYGYTGSDCSTTKPASTYVPKNSPFFPDTSTAGTGAQTKYNKLCEFTCKHGYCPINLCRPTATGVLVHAGRLTLEPTYRTTLTRDERNLCEFACLHGGCDEEVCAEPSPPTTTANPTPTPTPTPTTPPKPKHMWYLYSGWTNMVTWGSKEPLYGDKWFVFPAQPDCDDVYASVYRPELDDVSKDWIGVRCEAPYGKCSGGSDPRLIEILEMHFSNEPLYHWTIYRDQDYQMWGLDGKNYGYCEPFTDFKPPSFGCTRVVGLGSTETWSGNVKFRCYSDTSYEQIKASKRCFAVSFSI
ncbi:family 71 glycoside hydrolase [Rhypophila decipiens]|uniref:Family 71 glycoside hydrolase n=1 Tax=Rhypophila decipiens TaxID=261697 RepID=A0AAN7B7T1_9PEZI|nr:family 71 glycoside hydrolase [Rhypophila decipiens]